MAKSTCSVDGCDKRVVGFGLCPKHYRRLKLYGDPYTTQVIRGDDDKRFWSKVDFTGDCWIWTAAVDKDGYGRFRTPTTHIRAHRWAWERVNGPIPEGLMIDHLCRNPGCVNPAHLEPVTNRENQLRGVGFPAKNVARTHCPKGHPYNTENTRHHKGRRICRTCERERHAQTG